MKYINLRSDNKSGDCNMQQLAAVNPILISFLRLCFGVIIASILSVCPWLGCLCCILFFPHGCLCCLLIYRSLRRKRVVSMPLLTYNKELELSRKRVEKQCFFFFLQKAKPSIDFLLIYNLRKYKCSYLEEVSVHKFLSAVNFSSSRLITSKPITN